MKLIRKSLCGNDDLNPLLPCIELTGGHQQFPAANRIELLGVRLREIGLASPALIEAIDRSGINERIADLVKSGHVHPSVQKTYHLWLEWLKNLEEFD